jgi:hypothetical protein
MNQYIRGRIRFDVVLIASVLRVEDPGRPRKKAGKTISANDNHRFALAA